MSSSSKPRVLLVVTVYNGEEFVPRCLESARGIDTSQADVDVLVLDDCSPEPGWSERLSSICDELGVLYYRSPRNLGIPRNVSLGLNTAVEKGYDYVVISNSDVIYPRALMGNMLRVVDQDNVGSVTAWSNNVSVYSLPNANPDAFLADQGVVDWMDAVLSGHFGAAAMDIPAGISFCVMIPTAVVKDVGVMDPVFGRGYCEETDWSLRSLAAGYRNVLAPGSFVYHQGRGSNLAAGLVSGHSTSVPENEAIIDLRYPLFRSQVDAFLSSGLMQKAHSDATERIVRDAGRSFGYAIEVGWLPRSPDLNLVRCLVAPDGLDAQVVMDFIGFRHTVEFTEFDVADQLRAFFDGKEPSQVNLLDRGPLATSLETAFAGGDNVRRHGNYPARV